jgi:hypothetical protein
MQKTEISESGVRKSEIQNPDAVLDFTHISDDSTKLIKAETSSAILKDFSSSASEISSNEGLSCRNKSWNFNTFVRAHRQLCKLF